MKKEKTPQILDYFVNVDRFFLLDTPTKYNYQQLTANIFNGKSKADEKTLTKAISERLTMDKKAAKDMLTEMVKKGVIQTTANPFIYQVNNQHFFDNPDR
jgi:DNA-binding MarR family transcriptional regulator